MTLKISFSCTVATLAASLKDTVSVTYHPGSIYAHATPRGISVLDAQISMQMWHSVAGLIGWPWIGAEPSGGTGPSLHHPGSGGETATGHDPGGGGGPILSGRPEVKEVH